mmetsp:Transcript_59778/g.177150  ORF Transcript_59778/g.177150 Transcript_59778/m.177150 type:complete len:294 (-) Transcript_59778:478-1359(-)
MSFMSESSGPLREVTESSSSLAFSSSIRAGASPPTAALVSSSLAVISSSMLRVVDAMDTARVLSDTSSPTMLLLPATRSFPTPVTSVSSMISTRPTRRRRCASFSPCPPPPPDVFEDASHPFAAAAASPSSSASFCCIRNDPTLAALSHASLAASAAAAANAPGAISAKFSRSRPSKRSVGRSPLFFSFFAFAVSSVGGSFVDRRDAVEDDRRAREQLGAHLERRHRRRSAVPAGPTKQPGGCGGDVAAAASDILRDATDNATKVKARIRTQFAAGGEDTSGARRHRRTFPPR